MNEPLGTNGSADNTLRRTLSRLIGLRLTKFSVVGLVSTAVSFIVFNIVYISCGILPLAQVLCIFAGAANGSYWHRSWTFVDRRAESPMKQTLRFLGVTAVSCIISTLASAAIIAWWPFGHIVHGQTKAHAFCAIATGVAKHRYPMLVANAGALAGGTLALAWSYILSTTWAFRHG